MWHKQLTANRIKYTTFHKAQKGNHNTAIYNYAYITYTTYYLYTLGNKTAGDFQIILFNQELRYNWNAGTTFSCQMNWNKMMILLYFR